MVAKKRSGHGPLYSISDADTLTMIKMIQSHDALWNKENDNYRDVIVKQAQWTSIRFCFCSETGIECTEEDLQKKFSSLRSTFTKQLHKEAWDRESKKQRTGANQDRSSTPRFYDALQFLRGVINIPSVTDSSQSSQDAEENTDPQPTRDDTEAQLVGSQTNSLEEPQLEANVCGEEKLPYNEVPATTTCDDTDAQLVSSQAKSFEEPQLEAVSSQAKSFEEPQLEANVCSEEKLPNNEVPQPATTTRDDTDAQLVGIQANSVEELQLEVNSSSNSSKETQPFNERPARTSSAASPFARKRKLQCPDQLEVSLCKYLQQKEELLAAKAAFAGADGLDAWAQNLSSTLRSVKTKRKKAYRIAIDELVTKMLREELDSETE